MSNLSGNAIESNEGLGRCGKCKHWKKYTNKLDVDFYGDHAGECGSNKFVYEEDSQTPRDGLQYWDGEGYSAGFNTGESFGCVHWVTRISL